MTEDKLLKHFINYQLIDNIFCLSIIEYLYI